MEGKWRIVVGDSCPAHARPTCVHAHGSISTVWFFDRFELGMDDHMQGERRRLPPTWSYDEGIAAGRRFERDAKVSASCDDDDDDVRRTTPTTPEPNSHSLMQKHIIIIGRVISKSRLRALQRLASTDLDRKLIELTALDGLSMRASSTASGTQNRGTVEERRRREALMDEALAVFEAYDDLAKCDTLAEMQSLIGIEIDEEDVNREVALLRSSGFKDADDTDSDDGLDDADDDDNDDDGTGWCRLPDDDAEFDELAVVADAVDTSIAADSISASPMHSLEQDIESQIGMRLFECKMTDEEEAIVKSVLFSDRMPTDVDDGNLDTDGDGADDSSTMSLDVFEDFVSDMNAAHPCSDVDLDVDAIQPFMAGMDARALLTRILAWRRYKRK